VSMFVCVARGARVHVCSCCVLCVPECTRFCGCLHCHRDGLVANLHTCKYDVIHKAVSACGYSTLAEDDNVSYFCSLLAKPCVSAELCHQLVKGAARLL
jgi:hypothetical protein